MISPRLPMRWVLLAGALACAPRAPAADDAALKAFDHVTVDTAKTSIYVGSVTMSFSASTRQAGAYEATYVAKVFPYFFMNEKGKLTLAAPDEALRRLAKGETVEFSGQGTNTDGQPRRFEGTATPSDAANGKLKVRVHVSKRIELIFNTNYHFGPPPDPSPTPSPAK